MNNKKNIIMGLIISLILLIVIIIIIVIINSGDKLPIVEKEWINSNDEYSESIIFRSKGEFIYYTSTPNNEKNYTSCTKYKYDEKNKIIKLTCSAKVETKEIKLVEHTDQSITLLFGQEEKTYTLSQE